MDSDQNVCCQSNLKRKADTGRTCQLLQLLHGTPYFEVMLNRRMPNGMYGGVSGERNSPLLDFFQREGTMHTAYLKKVTDLNMEILSKLDVQCILLDIDNTIKKYGDTKPAPGVEEWVAQMRGYGVHILLFSNNFKKAVAPFADTLGLDYLAFCLKPSPLGYLRAIRRFHISRKNILVVGDQLFTDILGAKLLAMKTLLVEPVDPNREAATVKLRRRLLGGIKRRIISGKQPF